MVKQLLVMRHAKSDWTAGALSDHDRPLNRRGVESARTMGEVVTRFGLTPERVLSSTAVRATATAELAAAAGRWSAPIVTDRRLYEGSVDTVLSAVGETPSEVERLMVVGHQPTWGALLARLTGGSVAVRTATVAVVDLMLGGAWDTDGELFGELAGLLQPRYFSDD